MTSEKAPQGREARRLWIADEAERLCIPACFTPRWQRLYGRKD